MTTSRWSNRARPQTLPRSAKNREAKIGLDRRLVQLHTASRYAVGVGCVDGGSRDRKSRRIFDHRVGRRRTERIADL